MATAAEPQPAVLPLRGGTRDATGKVHPLLSGVAMGPRAWIHREDGRLAGLHALGIGVSKSDMMEIPVVSFLVEHPGAGPVLIDTGLHPSCAIDLKQNFGRASALAFRGMKMGPKGTVREQLLERDIDAREVKHGVGTPPPLR